MAAPVVKLSEIRAKFPMYADLSDEQLLIGVRKRFYPDIPMAKFAGMVDFDTQRQALQRDAAEASGPFLSGVGQAMTNLARGVGQAFGAVSREDVKDSRALDAGLSSTTGGKVGNVVGNVAVMLPAALIPGANAYAGAAGIGALTGALQPSESTGETLTNTAIGAAAGPAGIMLGRGVGATWNAGKALVEPFTKAGQERIAARTLQQFATDPKAAAAALREAEVLVPGSMPTMAQASGDAGLAQLERTLANNVESGKTLAAQYAAQRAARLGAVHGLAGDAAKREAAVAARTEASAPLYAQATGQRYQIDSVLADLLKRPALGGVAHHGAPSGGALQRAAGLAANSGRAAPITKAEAPARGLLVSESGAPLVTTQGKPGTITGQGLQDLKMALDDMLSSPLSGIGKNEANAIKDIRAQLVEWMGKASPAFRQADATFAQKSVPINTMDVAAELMKRLEPALARYGATTKEHASAYAAALDAAKETVKKATGINKPMAEMIDAQAARLLDNVARDLGRKAKADDLGRAIGSNTAQNLAAQNLLRRVLGPTGLPEKWAESNMLQGLLAPLTAVSKISGAERSTLERLTGAAMNPKDAAGLLEQALKDPKRLREALRYAPAGLLGYAHE